MAQKYVTGWEQAPNTTTVYWKQVLLFSARCLSALGPGRLPFSMTPVGSITMCPSQPKALLPVSRTQTEPCRRRDRSKMEPGSSSLLSGLEPRWALSRLSHRAMAEGLKLKPELSWGVSSHFMTNYSLTPGSHPLLYTPPAPSPPVTSLLLWKRYY